MSPFDELESPKSMMEFELGIVLWAIVNQIEDPEDSRIQHEMIMESLFEQADKLITEWHIKYEDEFNAATGC